MRSEAAPRSIDVHAQDAGALANGIEDLYNDAVDVLVVRRALASEPLRSAGAALDGGDLHPDWARPNETMPVEDIEVLGIAATPTYSTPKGPSLETYLEAAGWYGRAPFFGSGFDPAAEITRALTQFSGGRPVGVLSTADHRQFAPFTVRRLKEGKGIGLHHDLHMTLPMFSNLHPKMDARTLISYVFTLQGPEAGGELFVYDIAPDEPNPPKLPNGFMWDPAAVETRFASTKVATSSGDLFIFASARCLHRVAPVVGKKARVTMGGFLALDAAGERVLYWS